MPTSRVLHRTSRLSILLPVLLLLGWAVHGRAIAACIDYQDYLHRSGDLPMEAPLDGAVSGNLAYFGGGSTFQVADISNPDSVRIVGSIPVPGSGVALSGNLVCLAAAGDLFAVDVTDPGNPLMRDQISAGMIWGGDVAIGGHVAFLAGGGYGYGAIQAIDISHPDSLWDAGSLYLPSSAGGIAVAGTYAYVAYGDWNMPAGLAVVDISQPAQMQMVGSTTLSVNPSDIAIAGGWAFVASSGALQVIDISDPALPQVVATLPIDGGTANLVVAGQHVYLAGGALQVVDVTVPQSPALVGTVWVPGVAVSVTVTGDRALVGYSANPAPNGLAVVDISNPQSPPIVGGTSLDLWQPYEIAIAGSLAYIVDHGSGGGLRVCDVSDPQAPLPLGWAGVVGWPSALEVSDGRAYVTSGYGLNVLDIADPSTPLLVGYVATPASSANDVAVSGTYAFVADGEIGLQVIEIPPSGTPHLAASVDTPGQALGVSVAGGFAYVADWPLGLQVVDVSQPLAPVAVAALPLPSGPTCVAAAGSIVCAGVSSGLDVIDVSSPTAPQILGHLDLPVEGAVVNIAISGALVYLADDYAGYHVVDISDPVHPRNIGDGRPGVRTQAITVHGEFVYLGHWGGAAGEAGLAVAPAQCGALASALPVLAASASGLLLGAFPNPASRGATVRLDMPRAGALSVSIVDVSGRRVRTLFRGEAGAGRLDLAWDRRDDRGARVATGVYIVLAVDARGESSSKLVLSD